MTTRLGLRTVYLYAVCLITLVMVLIGGVQSVRATARVIYPGVEYYYEPALEAPGKAGEISEEERARVQERQEEAERRRAVLELVGALAMLGVAGPAYLYHWRRVQREHEGGLTRPLPSPGDTPPA